MEYFILPKPPGVGEDLVFLPPPSPLFFSGGGREVRLARFCLTLSSPGGNICMAKSSLPLSQSKRRCTVGLYFESEALKN